MVNFSRYAKLTDMISQTQMDYVTLRLAHPPHHSQLEFTLKHDLHRWMTDLTLQSRRTEKWLTIRFCLLLVNPKHHSHRLENIKNSGNAVFIKVSPLFHF
jgi:hypothetical protein